MKTYKGKKCRGGAGGQMIVVEEKGREHWLNHIERHSPDGFNWGYGGSGPADTALSILADCLGKVQAGALYQLFKRDFVAGWGDEFSINEKEIKNWARKKRAALEF